MAAPTDRSRLLPLVVALLAIAALWLMPDIETEAVDAGGQPVEAYLAVVVDPDPPPPDPADEFSGYGEIIVRISEGPRSGEEVRAFVELQTTTTAPQDLEAGEEVVLTFTDDSEGAAFASVAERYRLSLLGVLVGLLSAVMIVVVGGWQGARALVALGFTVVLVAKLLVPLILDGMTPVPLAVVVAALVTISTILLTEGLARVAAVAIAGTVGGLAITALLAGAASAIGTFGGVPPASSTSSSSVPGQRSIRAACLPPGRAERGWRQALL
jgi:uncharacterized membrane protein